MSYYSCQIPFKSLETLILGKLLIRMGSGGVRSVVVKTVKHPKVVLEQIKQNKLHVGL